MDASSLRMSLQSALIGFLLARLWPTPMTPQENVVVQTTAVATGTVSRFTFGVDVQG